MPRKSSVHFKPVSNVRFAVSHSERTDLSDPAYLLPKEHQLPNFVVPGSLSENELAALFIQQKEAMTGQAKARGSSPFWEGVVVLSDTDAKAQSENLQAWKVAYEKATSHKVLHMSIHLDEGYVDATGHPQYNPHAHVIVSRMDGKNRVIKLERKELAAVQDLTAIALKMERGSTLEERGGKRGRRHVGHREYRSQADEARLDLEEEKGKKVLESRLVDGLSQSLKDTKAKLKEVITEAAKVPQLEAQVNQQQQQIAQLHEQYRLARQALKDSGTAKQADYQALKKNHEAVLAKLASTEAELTAVTQENQVLRDTLAATKTESAALASEIQGKDPNPAFSVPGSPAPTPSQSKRTREAPPTTPEVAKTLQEAPKAQTQGILLPDRQKSLLGRLEASLMAFVDWIKGKSGQRVEVDTEHSDHYGPVVQLDDLHAVQSTGRGNFAIHQLDRLDKLPALDDSKMEIHYRGGIGAVKGQRLGKGRVE